MYQPQKGEFPIIFYNTRNISCAITHLPYDHQFVIWNILSLPFKHVIVYKFFLWMNSAVSLFTSSLSSMCGLLAKMFTQTSDILSFMALITSDTLVDKTFVICTIKAWSIHEWSIQTWMCHCWSSRYRGKSCLVSCL